MIPELFFQSRSPFLWVDVEYSKAQEFKEAVMEGGELSGLPNGLEIFRCPFLDILKEIESKVGVVDFDAISDQSDIVLQPFRKGDVSYIFLFDYPRNSVLYSPEDEYLERLEVYLTARERPYAGECLSPQAQANLAATRGLFIYREDFLRVVQSYTDWPLEVANELYRFLAGAPNGFNRHSEYEEKVPGPVRSLLTKEAKIVFLKSHMVAMSWFLKRSAILKSLHSQLYFDTIRAWEDRNGSCWSDLGFVHAANGTRYFSVFE